MSNLMMDRDTDVCERARSIHLAFKQTPVRMEAGAGTLLLLDKKSQLDIGMLDMNGTAGGISRFDEEDQGKEIEEIDMVISTEEADM